MYSGNNEQVFRKDIAGSVTGFFYDCKIELIDYGLDTREQIADWLEASNIPHFTFGRTGSIIYLEKKHATWFALKWT